MISTFSINTLGCKVNQYEGQQIRELLEQLGLAQVDLMAQDAAGRRDTPKPDLVVVNTCCVTHTASAKSRQYIRKAQKLNPLAIIVCGCLPTVQIDELNNLSGSNIHLIKHRQAIAATLSQILGNTTVSSNYQDLESRQHITIKAKNGVEIKCKTRFTNLPELPRLTSFKGHTRAFLKVQDGCDGSCSYCIVPSARPSVQNKPIEEVLEEAQGLVNAGHKEIVVTGIFLGAYGQETVKRKKWLNGQNDKLAEMLEKLAEIAGLERVRLSSLEPGDITGRLLDSFCKCRNIMPHLHLSIQSGSDNVLKRMRRQYRIGQFREKIELVKERLDRPALTADFIVGFPGETDEDFERTIELAKEVGFAKMHVFGFSPRKGTAAAEMQGAVNAEVIKRRSRILRELDSELGYEFRGQFIGQTDRVLVEKNDGRLCGRSERYFNVEIKKAGGRVEKNQLVDVKLVGNNREKAVGEMLS